MRLIDRDRFRETLIAVRITASKHGYDYDVEVINQIIALLDNCLTIEVEPVKYGYWEWVDGSLDNYDLKCTVCGGVQDSGFWERCPYCGAKMKNGE